MSPTAIETTEAPQSAARVAVPPLGGRGARRERRGSGKRIVATIAVVALVVGAVAWRVIAARRAVVFKYETASVDRGRVVARVTATGMLSALVTVQVGSQVSGTVASLGADYNTPVRKGQVIARIDPRLFEAAVEQARANVTAAEGTLAKARVQEADAARQARRQRELGQRNLVAQADVDTAQANAEAAAASVQAAEGARAQARAALYQANTNLAFTDIVSPTDGVVISRSIDVGQTVAASLQAPTLFVIAQDLKKMQVDTNVAESDVGRLHAGMRATFTVDAYAGRVFQGTVRQVRNSPQTVQNVVTYDAVVDVANTDLALRPGMTATATFVYAERDDAVRVPNAALRFRPPTGMPGAARVEAEASGKGGDGRRSAAGQAGAGGPEGEPLDDGQHDRHLVWVLRAGKPKPMWIRTGISDGTVTEVAEGELAPGDALVTDASGPPGSTLHGPRMF